MIARQDSDDNDEAARLILDRQDRRPHSVMGDYNEVAVFDRYDDEFVSILQQIEQGLPGDDPLSSTSPSQLKHTGNLLRQAADLIQQMAVEARSCEDVGQKRLLLNKVRECKAQHQQWQEKYNRQTLLFSGGSEEGGAAAAAHRERLLQMQNNDLLLNKQNDTLDRARQTMEETESVALEITEELGSNRTKLMRTHGRVRDVSGMANRARRILANMNQRAVQQKFIVYGVATALVVMTLFFLWFFWRS
jgi:Snare region anchored in the vesicle membrane C-terminus/Vesicle transport v-SNARE protein N-terminus